MLRIGTNLSSALRWALVVESSKRKQCTRNKERFFLTYRCYANWLASTIFRPNACSTFFGALCSAQEQQDTYECANFCHACIIQKSRFDCVIGFHIFNLLVSSCHNLLSWRHRKIIQMISRVFLLDIHFLSVLVSL